NRRLYRCIQANSNHIPEAKGSEDYWEDLCVKEGTYHEGEMVYDGYNSFYQFQVPQGQTITVTKDTCLSERADGLVNAPFEKFYDVYPYEGGVHDNIERIRNWIAKKVQLMDEQMNYKNEFVLGDVNHDGKVNIVDATSVTSYILNQKPNSFYEAEADINQDGEISITDVTSIVNMVLGK
ncbi:MAG: dockerin type I repeat-containing protein, partial [Prevotella sp.]|nr:dockerin type I repeat-containing protein [Prevotella sp.]